MAESIHGDLRLGSSDRTDVLEHVLTQETTDTIYTQGLRLWYGEGSTNTPARELLYRRANAIVCFRKSYSMCSLIQISNLLFVAHVGMLGMALDLKCYDLALQFNKDVGQWDPPASSAPMFRLLRVLYLLLGTYCHVCHKDHLLVAKVALSQTQLDECTCPSILVECCKCCYNIVRLLLRDEVADFADKFVEYCTLFASRIRIPQLAAEARTYSNLIQHFESVLEYTIMENPSEFKVYVSGILLSSSSELISSLLEQMVSKVAIRPHLDHMLAILAHEAKVHFDHVNKCLDYIFCKLNKERDRILLETVFIAKFLINTTLSANSITASVVAGLRSFLRLADDQIGHKLSVATLAATVVMILRKSCSCIRSGRYRFAFSWLRLAYSHRLYRGFPRILQTTAMAPVNRLEESMFEYRQYGAMSTRVINLAFGINNYDISARDYVAQIISSPSCEAALILSGLICNSSESISLLAVVTQFLQMVANSDFIDELIVSLPAQLAIRNGVIQSLNLLNTLQPKLPQIDDQETIEVLRLTCKYCCLLKGHKEIEEEHDLIFADLSKCAYLCASTFLDNGMFRSYADSMQISWICELEIGSPTRSEGAVYLDYFAS